MPRQHIQSEALSTRIVNGHVLYSHAVAAEGQHIIFISGQLARDQQGNVVGKGDMRAQLRQVGENLKAALAAAGATLNELRLLISGRRDGSLPSWPTVRYRVQPCAAERGGRPRSTPAHGLARRYAHGARQVPQDGVG